MSYAEWHPHDHPEYDAILRPKSAAELAALMSGGQGAAQAVLRDTRELHRRLYEALTPPEHPEYAGNYRGATGTSLEGRRAGAKLVTCDGQFAFIEPAKVKTYLDTAFRVRVDGVLSPTAPASSYDLFISAAKVFQTFGMIHPYLDGNGHIQRLVFAGAVAFHGRLELLNTWTIHPRPYDIEMATAFEQGPNALKAIAEVLLPHVKL